MRVALATVAVLIVVFCGLAYLGVDGFVEMTK